MKIVIDTDRQGTGDLEAAVMREVVRILRRSSRWVISEARDPKAPGFTDAERAEAIAFGREMRDVARRLGVIVEREYVRR